MQPVFRCWAGLCQTCRGPVDLDHQGLIVPVVPRAEELTLRGLARRIHELANRARTKKLTADDISGGTFSITNAGPFGT